MSKHTSKPWSVDTGSRGQQFIRGPVDRGGTYIARVHPMASRVAYHDGDEPETPSAEARANAHLLAAAPEMFDEIEKQITWLKHIRAEVEKEMRTSILMGVDQSIKYLGAALAKARGEG